MRELYILGVKINDISLPEASQQLADFLLTNKKGYLVTPNPEICLRSYKSKVFRRILQNAWLAIPDGFGLKIGARILGKKLNHTTTGADLCQEVLKLSEQKKYSVLILGGKPEAGERTISLCAYKYPRLKINYLNGGNFNNIGISDQKNLIEQINNLKPDIIFTCLGAPKQEYFMAKNLDQINCKLMMGVGGTIDFLAEQIKRAPASWRRLGLEWLWRFIQEPWRWKRIARAVIIFPLACLRWKFGTTFIYRKNVAAFIINNQKQIFLGKHAKTNEWKLPQGGAKNATTKSALENTVIREMSEELGTTKFIILKMLKDCYRYNWPSHSRDIDIYKGQKQTLFLMQYLGSDNDISLDTREHSAWRWVDKDEVLKIAAPNRRKLIQIGLDKFKDYL